MFEKFYFTTYYYKRWLFVVVMALVFMYSTANNDACTVKT